MEERIGNGYKVSLGDDFRITQGKVQSIEVAGHMNRVNADTTVFSGVLFSLESQAFVTQKQRGLVEQSGFSVSPDKLTRRTARGIALVR